jgi:DNA-binding response OmpR family regulator
MITQQYKPDPKRKNRIVWVIDDEKSILDAVGSYLVSSGYQQVTPFLNATSPLSLLREKRIPDAIVCDILMPQVSGIDFLSVVRGDESSDIMNIPFILLTAKGLTEDRIQGYDAGADGYLMKPFDPEELVAILDRVIERKNLLQLNDECVTVEEIRKDLGEIKELLKKKESMILGQANLLQSYSNELNNDNTSQVGEG